MMKKDMEFNEGNISNKIRFHDVFQYHETHVDQIDEAIKENLSEVNITKIFLTYINKHKITGIDKINNDSFWKNIALHINHISSTVNDYHYSPYLEKLISKGRNKSPRVISIPSIKDRIVLYVLKEILHQYFPECVNKELVNIKIKNIHQVLSELNSGCIFKIDIKGFYDTINQKILFDKLKKRTNAKLFLMLIENAIINPTVPKDYSKSDRNSFFQYYGIPQGLAISNILANIYLSDFDNIISSKCIYYYRYVDDILLICDNIKKDDLYIEVKKTLMRLGLEINTDKTKIISVSDTFTFLGYEINKKNISIRPESIQNHINSIFAMMNAHKTLLTNKTLWEEWVTEDLLMNRIESDINEKITGAVSQSKKYGWLFYFSAINDLSILFKMNLIVKSALHRTLPSKIANKISLKSYIKAYHEIKRNPKSKYIHNYDIYDTIEKIIDYLDFRGYLNRDKEYTKEEIIYLFSIVREQNLAKLQKDLGSLS